MARGAKKRKVRAKITGKSAIEVARVSIGKEGPCVKPISFSKKDECDLNANQQKFILSLLKS
jgi:hypothetical protein